ncbi:MAG: heterodisulfide reductase-related iron-sulfur binding cluster [Adlercreutzia equolifaciens]
MGRALCCGAAGAVSLVDQPVRCPRPSRARRGAREAGADLVVANCPTCAYTFAATRRGDAAGAVAGPAFCQYLELLFEAGFDWSGVFGRLESNGPAVRPLACPGAALRARSFLAHGFSRKDL